MWAEMLTAKNIISTKSPRNSKAYEFPTMACHANNGRQKFIGL